jgi:beta-lactam-binding protein with PASTA domain
MLVPLAAVLALSMVPMSASADLRCPKGQHNTKYCKKQCVVPKLVGKHQKSAVSLLKSHDCRVGTITKQETDNDKKTHGKGGGDKLEKGFEGGVVVSQGDRAGSVHSKDHKVNLVVET